MKYKSKLISTLLLVATAQAGGFEIGVSTGVSVNSGGHGNFQGLSDDQVKNLRDQRVKDLEAEYKVLEEKIKKLPGFNGGNQQAREAELTKQKNALGALKGTIENLKEDKNLKAFGDNLASFRPSLSIKGNAASVPVRLSVGYGFDMGANWFTGVHGFIGRMGGSTSSTMENAGDTDTKFIVSPGLAMGLSTQLGRAFGANRVFATVGWTAARMNAVLRNAIFLDNEFNPNLSQDLTQSQWKNAVSVGAGYDRVLSENVRMGINYTATFFGPTHWNKWSIKGQNMKNMSDDHKKALNTMYGIKAGRMVNHTVSLGVTYVIPSKS